jgi:hypothetical protein
MKLRLSEVASAAEVIGAIAIVISLIYVGKQVYDSTRAVRSATANETSAAISSWYTQVGSNPQATRVFLDGVANPDSLSREESAQFIYLMHGLQLEYQAAYWLSQEQTLDVELQESLTNTITGVREQPGFLMYWGQRRELFEPKDRAQVDDLLANGTTNTNLERVYRSSDQK